MQGRLLVGAEELEGHGRCQSPGRVRCNEGLGGALAPIGGGPWHSGEFAELRWRDPEPWGCIGSAKAL
jgi:hypothetical protein